MKRLLFVLVLIGACIAGYYYTTGKLPWVEMTPEEQQVAALREEFGQIRQQWKQAGRAGSLGGAVDTSTITDLPVENLEKLEKNLDALIPQLKTPSAKHQAGVLRLEVTAFKNDMR